MYTYNDNTGLDKATIDRFLYIITEVICSCGDMPATLSKSVALSRGAAQAKLCSAIIFVDSHITACCATIVLCYRVTGLCVA